MKLDLPRPVACGLIALHAMAQRQQPLTEAEIAREYLISRPLMRKVTRALLKGGLIAGRKEQGYTLARAAHSITVEDVMEAFSKPARPARECGMEYDSCAFRTVCPVASFCRAARDSLGKVYRTFTVADLAQEAVPMP